MTLTLSLMDELRFKMGSFITDFFLFVETQQYAKREMRNKAPNVSPTTIAVTVESLFDSPVDVGTVEALGNASVDKLLAAHVPEVTEVPISQQARSA
jgi:hypothetical protein